MSGAFKNIELVARPPPFFWPMVTATTVKSEGTRSTISSSLFPPTDGLVVFAIINIVHSRNLPKNPPVGCCFMNIQSWGGCRNSFGGPWRRVADPLTISIGVIKCVQYSLTVVSSIGTFLAMVNLRRRVVCTCRIMLEALGTSRKNVEAIW